MRRELLLGIGLGLFLLMTKSVDPVPLSAQSPVRWSTPRQIRGIAEDSNPPYLVADQNRTVHAFYSQWTGNNLAVFYNQWTRTTGWTIPVDILLSPNKGQATVLGAFLDSKSIVHVIFFGGIAEGAEIYYSSAPAADAGQARAWSKPIMVGEGATAPASGSLFGDDKGNLFIVYSGRREGYGIYATQSIDGGVTWSDPIPIFLTRSSVQSTCCISTYSNSQGWLHTIWLVVDKSGQGRGIYYARLNMRDKQWSFPITLAQAPTGLGVHNPAITEHRGLVFAAFYDADMGGHYVMRTSSDDGQSWTDLFAPFARYVGANGPVSFVADSNDDLHLFWGERTTGNPDVHGMWHSVWKGARVWSEPEAIVSGPQTAEFDPSAPKAVVSQGNVLLVTWRQDPGLSGNGVWYSYEILSAPEKPLLALPTLAVPSTPTPSETSTSESSVPTRTAFPRPVFTPQADGDIPASIGSNPSIGVLIAIVPVVLIVLMLVVVRNFKGPA